MIRLAAIRHSSVWWLRSPNTSNANNVYNVQASGSSNNNNANNSYGFSLDCITESQFGSRESNFHTEKETLHICKELQTLPHINHAANRNRRRRPLPIKEVPDTSSDPFTFENLLTAANECCKGVLWKDSVMRWRLDKLHLCRKLERELENGRYRLSPYVTFRIVSPKPRKIRSLHFRDRVVQRLMCNHGLYRDLTRGNIYDNGACQRCKGTGFTLDRMKVLLRRYYRQHGADGWVLRLDIHKFFDSIPHDRLCDMIRKKVKNKRFVSMVCDIIHSFGTDTGIGLGSQISQLMAVSYLSELDHEIKESMKIRCYSRYCDDIILVHPDKEYLKNCMRRISSKLTEMGLTLNPKSTMHRLKQGIIYLKFRFVLTASGKVVYSITRSGRNKVRRRTVRLINKFHNNLIDLAEIQKSFSAWASFALHGGNRYAVIRMKRQLEACL